MSLLDSATIFCPYCGEQNELVIDTSVPQQEYIEDCVVCCRPMLLRITVDRACEIEIEVHAENE